MTDDEAINEAVRRTGHERFRTLVVERPEYWAVVRQIAGCEPAPPAEYPPLWEQAASAVGAAVTFVASGFATVDDETYTARLAVCNDCPDFAGDADRCRICGCSMRLKARAAAMRCPAGKW
jgi:Family of unknown function (DUF6171)